MKKRSSVYLIILLVLAFTWNAFMCTMSPFRDVLFSCDSNCFYMAGKCMALGYTPYVDFVDTKGPFLFIVYMLGYLLSPNQTVGVYVLASLATFGTFVFLFQIGLLYKLTNQQAFLAVLVCSLSLFLHRSYGYGARAEQFLLPFTVWILYTACKITLQPDEGSKNWRQFSYSIGVSTGIILFTKFNYAIYPVCTLLLSALIIFRTENAKNILKTVIKGFSLSFVITCFPFIVYLISIQAFDDFVQVYFKLGSSNAFPGEHAGFLGKARQIVTILHEWMRKQTTWAALGSCLFLFSPFYAKKSIKNASLFLFLSSGALLFCSCLGLYNYYSLMFSPLVIFFAIILFSKLPDHSVSTSAVACAVMAYGLYANYCVPRNEYREKWNKINKPNVCKDFTKIEKIIASKPKAKILYIDFLGTGFSIRTGALPACPNWFCLNFADKKHMASAYSAVERGNADFVISRGDYKEKKSLYQSGYKILAEFLEGEYCSGTMLLWGKERVEW